MMNNSSNHITRERLEHFVSGRLTDHESDQVMAHLAECDVCLSSTDELWASQPVGEAVSYIVDLDADTATRVERKLVRKIHRSNMTGSVVRLGTQGFLSVMLGLLRPLMGAPARRK